MIVQQIDDKIGGSPFVRSAVLRLPAWIPLFILVAIALPAFLYDLGRPALGDDEAKHAEIPREMIATGDWLTPHINGTRYFEKPPLVYWLTALSYHAFGVSEFSARLPNGLAATALLLVTYVLGSTLYGRRAGFLAAVVLGTTIEMHVVSRECGVDLLMTLALTAAALALAKGRWYLMYAALGLSTLIKGPIGLVLPAMTLAAYVVVTADVDLLRRLRLPAGLGIVLAIGAPWYAAMAVHHSDFLWFFFVHEHVFRFLGLRWPRESPVPSWLFATKVVAEFFPWIVILPQALGSAQRDPAGRFATMWMAVVMAFFSLSVNKQDTYGFMLFPAAALLTGRWWVRPRGRWTPLGPALAALAAAAALILPLPVAPPPMALPFLECLAVGCTLATILLSARRMTTAFAVLALMVVPLASFVHGAFLYYEPERSSRALAEALRQVPSDAAIVLEEPDEYEECAGMNFYLRRTVWLVRRDQGSGLRFTLPDPETFILTRDELTRRVREGDIVYWVGNEGERGLDGKILARSGGRVAMRVLQAAGAARDGRTGSRAALRSDEYRCDGGRYPERRQRMRSLASRQVAHDDL
jgi:4-amino-4-deoxy-L-arabinose transferase-like glycosyltransferase